jgi:DNA-binding MarR family transcriptional regulator
MENKRLGLFVPLELINNQELDWVNKILLSEITSLSKLDKGCYASNKWLSDFIGMETSSLQRRLKFLVENGYIITTNKYKGKKCIGRIITPTGKVMGAKDSSMGASATTMGATATNDGSECYHSMGAGNDPMITDNNSDIKTFIKTDINTEKIDDDEWITNYFNEKQIK